MAKESTLPVKPVHRDARGDLDEVIQQCSRIVLGKQNQIRLAVSLHGATDEVRNRIMPVNTKWPVDELFAALREWTEKPFQAYFCY